MPPVSETSVAIQKRRWAIVRFILGQLQMIGAGFGLYFLITTGPSRRTCWIAAITGAMTLTSICLFKVFKRGQS